MTLRPSISSQYPSDPAVYTFIFPTGHFYIGSTICLSKRLRDHRGYLEAGKHQNFKMQKLYDIWDEIKIHFSCCDDREEAYDKEQSLLDRHHGDEYCLNISTDARSLWGNGRGRPKEVSLRIANAQKGKEVSDEFREQCRQRMLGNVPSALSRRRCSETLKGRVFSDDHRAKISASLIGKPRHKTREAEAKRQATLLAMGGIKHTDESRRKIAEHNQVQVEVDGVIYPSMSHACEALNIKATTMSARIKNPNYPSYKRLGIERRG